MYFVGHLPIYEPSTEAYCLCWNYSEILDLLHKHRSVVAYLAGHDHEGGQAVDAAGIQHITLPGVIETPPNTQAFGVINVYPDRLVFEGLGKFPELTVYFKQKIKAK
jgi:manganese-dependent ADP-ribose/CDP-alcohol diphosphatase